MRRLMGIGLLALGMVGAGCVATHVPPVDRRVTIAENIAGDVYVSDVRCAKGTSDHLTFQANVVNLTSREQWVDWKVVWLDAAGLELDSIVSTWSSAAIAPKDIRALKGTAPHPAAADMRFYLRRTVR